jgi:hypothetical protein
LTGATRRVNSDSFFDISKVLPVGGETRDPSVITVARQSQSHKLLETAIPWNRRKLEAARGSARVYSELLVEENKRWIKAKIEALRR